MEIMNYNQMLENANAVKVLVNKTIECSKDYTDIKTDDVLDQIAQYLANTISDILHDPICSDRTFRHDSSNGYLSFGAYGGAGTGAQAQFFFACGGTILRIYFSAIGYWWADKTITDAGMRSLIKDWPGIKQYIHDGINRGIKAHNNKLSKELSKQLELHEAIKNFKV
jgi:hypothetical protein